MPANQCIGFDNEQSIPPIKPAGQSGERESDRIGSTSRFDFPFDKEAQLFSKKQIFGGYRCLGFQTEPDKR
jgi:hypothetical protein